MAAARVRLTVYAPRRRWFGLSQSRFKIEYEIPLGDNMRLGYPLLSGWTAPVPFHEVSWKLLPEKIDLSGFSPFPDPPLAERKRGQ